VDVHYVFFAPKAVGTTDSSSYNTHSLAWLDNGTFKLTEQWTFGYLRESVNPFFLKVNGKEYDLRQGRVFLPHDDGTLEQRQLEVSLATAMDPDAMAKLIANPAALPSAPDHVDFKVLRVENPPDTRALQIFFERDDRPGLGFEVGESFEGDREKVVFSDNDYRLTTARWVGPRDARVLSFELPTQFKSADAKRAAAELQARLFAERDAWRKIPAGAVPLIGKVKHRDGWHVSLFLRVKPEPGFVSPDKTNNSKPDSLQFDPVIERDVFGVIDFDSGKVVLADDFPESLTKSQDIADNVLNAISWMEREGMDAVTEPSSSLKGVGLKAKPVDDDAWEKLTPEQVIATLEMTKRETWQDLDPKRQADEDIKAPETWVFETREGSRGILQVLEHTERGVKLRYKLVQGGAKPPASSATAQRSVFGLQAERMITSRDTNRDGVVAFRFKNNLPFQPPNTLTGYFQKPEALGFTPELKQWMLDEKVDLLLHFGAKGYTMLSVDMRDGTAGQPTEWDFISPEKAAPLLAGLEKLNSNPGPRVAGESGYRDGLCDLRVFRTREGQVGFYQLRGLDDADGRGVMIRYKLVLTDEAKPASPTSAASFGPVIERTLNYQRSHADAHDVLRLLDGAVSRLPPGFFERGEFTNRQWLAEGGSKIFPGLAIFPDEPPGPHSWGLGSADVEFSLIPDAAWNDPTTERIQTSFADKNNALRHWFTQGAKIQCLSAVAKWPATLAFRAGDGSEGVLQILEINEADPQAPIQMKLRYRLVQGATMTAPNGAQKTLNAKTVLDLFEAIASAEQTFGGFVEQKDAAGALAWFDQTMKPKADQLAAMLAGTELEQRTQVLVARCVPLRAALEKQDWDAVAVLFSGNPDRTFEDDLRRLVGAKATSAATDAKPAFGPMRERVLPQGEPCREQLFQFHSGEVFVRGNGPGTSAEEAALDEKRIDDAGGADMSAGSTDDQIFISGRGCFFTRDIGGLKWNELTAEDLVERLKYASQIEGEVKPMKKDLPVSYLFKTARGEVGVMEVLGTVEVKHKDWTEQGMKFRYKLVKGTGTPMAAAPAKSSLVFGAEMQGLQAALEVTPGEPFKLRIHIRNASDHGIGIDGAHYRQEDECLLTDAEGKPVPVTKVTHDIAMGTKSGYFAPGQVAVFECAGLSFQSIDKCPSSAGYVAQAKPGRYTLRIRLRLPGVDVPYNDNSWKGELETGPVTIQVKDLSAQTVERPSDAIFSSHLGKPVEITVSDLQTTHEHCAFNFDTGKLMSVPDHITFGTITNPDLQPVAVAWAKDNQVDAIAFITTKDGEVVKCGLLCPDLVVSKVENKKWTPDLADPGMLKERFEKAMHEWGEIPQIAELTSDGEFPAAYLILDTRTHRRGVLQILGTTDQPRGVKIGYRLVEGAAVKKITPAASSH
jgi:hypothetical protein